MTERTRWLGILALVALLVWSRSGGGLPLVVEPGADKLWIVAITDTPTRTTEQRAVLMNPAFWQATGHHYEHYEKSGGEAQRFAAFSQYADEMFFQDAATGALLGVVEIPAKPTAEWATSQIARYAK